MIVPALSREQVRRVDRVAIDQFGMSGLVLMENAGRGAAEVINSVAPPGLVVILCGKGNNGGDGYVIARHLQIAGRDVRVVSIVGLDELSGDAEVNASIAKNSEIEIQVAVQINEIANGIASAEVIVDCLLGTGAQGELRGVYADAVAAANASQAMRIAIDVPTGLDCDTGKASKPTFQANHTITFVASKIGFEKQDAGHFVGVVHEVGIGVPPKLLHDMVRPLC